MTDEPELSKGARRAIRGYLWQIGTAAVTVVLALNVSAWATLGREWIINASTDAAKEVSNAANARQLEEAQRTAARLVEFEAQARKLAESTSTRADSALSSRERAIAALQVIDRIALRVDGAGTAIARLEQIGKDIDSLSTALATDPKMQAAVASRVSDTPVGTVSAWLGDSAVLPSQWVIAKGQTPDLYRADWDRTTLDRLFGPSGIPDLRGHFLRGASSDSTVDPEGPRPPRNEQEHAVAGVVYQSPGVINLAEDDDTGKPKFGPGMYYGVGSAFVDRSFAGKADINGGKRAETRPVNIAVHWIIKVR